MIHARTHAASQLTRTLESLAFESPQHLGAMVAVGGLEVRFPDEFVAHALADSHRLLGIQRHGCLGARLRLPALCKQSWRGDASLDVLSPLLELVPSTVVPFEALPGIGLHQRTIFARVSHSDFLEFHKNRW